MRSMRNSSAIDSHYSNPAALVSHRYPRLDIRNRCRTCEPGTRKVTVSFGPFLRNDDARIGPCWCQVGKIKLPHDERDLLELAREEFALSIPGRHAPAGFLRSAQIGIFVELLGRCVRVTPQVDSDAAGSDSRVDLCPIVSGHPLWRKLCG